MKIFKNSRFAVTILVVIFAISLSNCTIHSRTGTNRASYNAKKLPPGQAKKIYGGKSAKSYSPGHNK